MTSITVTTLRGALVAITASDNGGLISASVNGKPHTFSGVTLGHNATLGHYIALAGNTKAQIDGANVADLKEFFAAAANRHAEWVANYKLTAEEFSARLEEKMNRPDSDL